MKITNKFNLPQTFVSFCKDEYEYGENEYRATSLLKGYKEMLLERRHRDDIERDVSDMIWLLFGTAVHSVLEKSKEEASEFKEERLKVKFGKYILSGQFDLYNAKTKTLTDYKTASVWKIIYENYNDWERQLLIYSYMLTDAGFEVDKAEIVAILKDHSKSKAKIDSKYPQLPVEKVVFPVYPSLLIDIQIFILDRFNTIDKLSELADDDIPPCTMEERYNKGIKYAVMKKGRKAALRVADTYEDADSYIIWAVANKGIKEKDLSIEERKGEDLKCKDYCNVCKWCNYYKENVEGK